MTKPEGHKYPNKEKGDWQLIGQGKSTETLKKNMKGRWTIKWNEELQEYEEIEKGDDFNISSKSKGDLDYLKERHMNYRDFYKHLNEGEAEALNTPAKINYTDNDDYANSTVGNKDVPNVTPPLNQDTVVGNELKGGVGDATAPSDVNPAELAMGVQVEMEHTNDLKVATEIALDHLSEEPHYYTKLNQAGLTDEFKTVSPSGYGDPTSAFNQQDRLGNSVTCGPGNNIVGTIGNTPDGHVDGKKDSKPIINKTIDIEVPEPEFNDIKEAIISEKKKGGKRKPKPTNPSLWSRAKSAARAKFDVYPSAYANGWAAKWYKSHGGGWRMGK